MESEKNLEIDKSLASIPLIHCNSVGGALARNLGFSENFGSEIATSRIQSDTNRTFLKTTKKDFLPFLNERDGMNRLLTNRSRFRPGTIEDSLNPTFYYKSSRFNKFKLILGQAERTKNSLGKLLSFQNENDQGPNFLEADKIKRTNKLLALDKNTSAKLESWLLSERNPPLTEQSEDDIEEKNIFQPSQLGVDVPVLHSANKNQSLACSLSKYVSEINANKKDQTFVVGNMITSPKAGSHPSKKQAKSLSGLNKNIFAPKNDFCNYYQKLDQDIRQINTPSFDLRRKAHSSVSNLNAIIKRFEEDKDALLLEDLYILSTPPKLSQRTPRMEWFTSLGSPKEEALKNKPRLFPVESQPLPLSVKTPEKKTPQKKKIIIKSSVMKKYNKSSHIQA